MWLFALSDVLLSNIPWTAALGKSVPWTLAAIGFGLVSGHLGQWLYGDKIERPIGLA
jgi:hypothetical protein